VDKFGGGPVGLKTISAALSEEEATIEEVHEPYLLQLGLLERTPRGRVVTEKGYSHLGEEVPKTDQPKLI
jgi:holliday junction DNA helicase RuvB